MLLLVRREDVAHHRAEAFGVLDLHRSMIFHLNRVLSVLRDDQRLRKLAAIRDRVRAHPAMPARRKFG